jgi:hypothetical protein
VSDLEQTKRLPRIGRHAAPASRRLKVTVFCAVGVATVLVLFDAVLFLNRSGSAQHHVVPAVVTYAGTVLLPSPSTVRASLLKPLAAPHTTSKPLVAVRTPLATSKGSSDPPVPSSTPSRVYVSFRPSPSPSISRSP